MKSLPKNSGFKTPESYFENFSEKLNNSIAQETAIPKTEGFTIPDDYFSTLHTKIQTKLNQKEPKVVKLHSFKKKLYAASSIAAAVAILIAAVVFNNSSSTSITFNDIAASDIESYFNENDIEFSTYDLAQILPVDDINISDVVESNFNENEIMNYLESNNSIDIQDIYLEDDEEQYP